MWAAIDFEDVENKETKALVSHDLELLKKTILERVNKNIVDPTEKCVDFDKDYTGWEIREVEIVTV